MNGANKTENSQIPPCILVAGVGGQGVISLARLLGAIIYDLGEEITIGQLHGMAQRSGTVSSSIRIGEDASTHILAGSVDLLIGLDLMETCRHSSLLSRDGTIIALNSTHRRSPLLESTQPAPANAALIKSLEGVAGNLNLLSLPDEDDSISEDPGMALLGWAVVEGLLGLTSTEVRDGLQRHLSSRRSDSGLLAFDNGARLVVIDGTTEEEPTSGGVID